MLDSYHYVDLWLPPFRQVNNVDSIVIKVLNTAMEILLQKSSWFSWDRDSSKTELWEKNKHNDLLNISLKAFTAVVHWL